MTSPRYPVLDQLRVIAMFMVLLVHSPVNEELWTTPVVSFLQRFIAVGAVPAFFMLSGYLGARKLDSRSISFREYSLEKIRTLVIPFLFWNLSVLSLVLLIKILGLDSGFRGQGAYFDVELTFSSIVSAMFGIGRWPIVFQLWFLRDLIVVVFLAFFIRRYLPKIPLLPWLLLLLVPVPMASSLGYYLLGHWMRESLPPDKFPEVRGSVLFCVSWILLGIWMTMGAFVVPYPLLQIGSAAFALMLAIATVSTPWLGRLSVLGPAMFFVYATHSLLFTVIGKMWQVSGLRGYGSIFCYLIVPLIVFPLCVGAYWVLKALSPRLIALATGGR